MKGFTGLMNFWGHTSLKGLEVQVTNILLAVEHMIQERAEEAKKQKQGINWKKFDYVGS